MKRCPECRRDYTDDRLHYCLDDGTALLDGPASGDEPATEIFASESSTRVLSTIDSFQSDPATISTQNGASRRKLAVAGLLSVLVLAAIGIAAYRFYGNRTNKQIDSIAVMPFVNESGNPEVEYLSDGMTESLINSLSTLPNLSVKARNTVFRYKGKDIDEKKVGQELSVQAVLFGRFIQRGDDLTLFLSLVDSSTGNTLWGDQYDRKMGDLPVLRNDIARDVAKKLRNRLSNVDTNNLTKNYTANAEALRLYFSGRFQWSKRTAESVRTSIDYFNQAIEKDPNFALAYSGLADAYVVPVLGMPPHEVMPKARVAATRAIELDDTLAEAHTSLARVLQIYDWNWVDAEREYKRAMELDPRYPLAHQWYGGYLERLGRMDEALAARRVALELDPLSASTNFELGLAYFYSRNYDAAIPQIEKTLQMEPGFPAALQILLIAYVEKGQSDLALAKIREVKEDTSLASAAQVYALVGRKDDARRLLAELERRYRDKAIGREFVPATTLSFVYLALDEKDKAIEWLEKGYEERAFQMQFLKIDPRWDKLRDEPRFQELLKKVGLS